MARFEMRNADKTPLGKAPDGDRLLQLGLRSSVTAATPDDRVNAHKWFNIAAMCGNAEAARLRREISEEMSSAEVAAAQRAARDWITHH